MKFSEKSHARRIRRWDFPVVRRDYSLNSTVKPMNKLLLRSSWHCLLPAAGLLALAAPASAAVALMATVSPLNTTTGRYTYTYSVINSASPDEIITVVLPVSKTAALMGLTAPTGFVVNFDTFQGLVNFDLDTIDSTMQTFAANSTVSGFSFTSPIPAASSMFTARDVNMDFTDFTSAPIPEPSAAFLGFASIGLLVLRRRR